MKYRTLGSTDLASSAIGLGCMGFSQGYGATDDAASARVIAASIEAGVTLMDTAMSYGNGHNETLLGGTLAGLGPNLRDKVRIATKFGIRRSADGVELDGAPDRAAGYCEASLGRLGIDAIDLYYLHRVDPRYPLAETVGAMADLVTGGKVRHIGLSEVTAAQLREAASVHPITAVQFEWSMLWRMPETDLIPAARELGIGLVPYSPLGRGFLAAPLSDDDIAVSPFRRGDPRFGQEALDQNRRQAAALAELARARGLTAGQLALAWLLAQGEDVVPIPGTRRVERALENAHAADVTLSEKDLEAIDGAVPPDQWVGDRTSFAVPVTRRGVV